MDGPPTRSSDPRVEQNPQLLDVEDENRRQERIQTLFSKLDASSSATTRTPFPSQQPFDFGDRSTFPVAPPAELLARVQAFLPELAASNADLLQRARDDPESVDIEHLGAAGPYIEMNLGLGVFEQRGSVPAGANIPVADVDLDACMEEEGSEVGDEDEDEGASDSEEGDTSSSEDSDSSSDSGSSETSSSDSVVDVDALPRPVRPLPRRSLRHNGCEPAIVVLSSTTTNDSPRGNSQD